MNKYILYAMLFTTNIALCSDKELKDKLKEIDDNIAEYTRAIDMVRPLLVPGVGLNTAITSLNPIQAMALHRASVNMSLIYQCQCRREELLKAKNE